MKLENFPTTNENLIEEKLKKKDLISPCRLEKLNSQR